MGVYFAIFCFSLHPSIVILSPCPWAGLAFVFLQTMMREGIDTSGTAPCMSY